MRIMGEYNEKISDRKSYRDNYWDSLSDYGGIVDSKTDRHGRDPGFHNWNRYDSVRLCSNIVPKGKTQQAR